MWTGQIHSPLAMRGWVLLVGHRLAPALIVPSVLTSSMILSAITKPQQEASGLDLFDSHKD